MRKFSQKKGNSLRRGAANAANSMQVGMPAHKDKTVLPGAGTPELTD